MLILAALSLLLLGGSSGRLHGAEHGTWSLVAADPRTGEVGAALASCVAARPAVRRTEPPGYRIQVGGGGGAFDLLHLAPGAGAIVAQARVDPSNAVRLDRAAAVLGRGGTAAEALAAARKGDPLDAERQYGAVALAGDPAAYSGEATLAWSGHRLGEGVAVQGNILVGAPVVDAALAAYQEARVRGGDLAGALRAGLEAGAAAGGDRRCAPGQAALFAFLAVAGPEDRGATPRVWWAAGPMEPGGRSPIAALSGPSVRVIPLTALLAAAAIGFVLALFLWRRGRD